MLAPFARAPRRMSSHARGCYFLRAAPRLIRAGVRHAVTEDASSPLSMESLLQQAARAAATAAAVCADDDACCALRGEGWSFSTRALWSLRFDPSSPSFAEVLAVLPSGGGPTLRWGHEAASGRTWQSDLSGASRRLLPGDDARDRCLLSTAVRTGQWVAAVQTGALLACLVAEHVPLPTGVRRAPTTCRTVHELSLSLPGSPVRARLWLCASDFMPVRLSMRLHSGGSEEWSWAEWPRRAAHSDADGHVSLYRARRRPGDAALARALEELPFAAATTQPPALDASQPSSLSAEVEVIHTASGLFLLRGSLCGEGTPADGWFLLDPSYADGTGALEPAAANAARLVVAGPRLRRAGLSLGGLEVLPPRTWWLQRPGCASSRAFHYDGSCVTGLLGVLGADALQRCVLELQWTRRYVKRDVWPRILASVTPAGAYTPTSQPRVTFGWQRMRIIDGAPHVYAELDLEREPSFAFAPPVQSSPVGDDNEQAATWTWQPGAPLCGWFRISLGAVDAKVVLGAAVANRAPALMRTCFDMAPDSAGVASSAGPQLIGFVQRLRLRGATFHFVYTLAHAGPDDPLSARLSSRAAGMLCPDLLQGSMLVLDFAGGRAAIVPLILDEDIVHNVPPARDAVVTCTIVRSLKPSGQA
jgi:hypothetical protein